MRLLNKATLAILALTSTACGQQESYIETDLVPYVNSFKQLANEYGVKVSTKHLIVVFISAKEIKDRTGKDSVVGICNMANGKNPTVFISEDYWVVAGESMRTALMYHELGHCLLKRDHQDGTTPGGTAVSVMNSYIVNRYNEFKNAYNEELFYPEKVRSIWGIYLYGYMKDFSPDQPKHEGCETHE